MCVKFILGLHIINLNEILCARRNKQAATCTSRTQWLDIDTSNIRLWRLKLMYSDAIKKFTFLLKIAQSFVDGFPQQDYYFKRKNSFFQIDVC